MDAVDSETEISALENKDIEINIFDSKEIDLKPIKHKKRRRVDDYDYNDPFFESFEGEFNAVEIECKLENFFIYKGPLTEDPRKVSRKYNNALKKKKLQDSMASIDNKVSVDQNEFEFEKVYNKSLSSSSKYKKEPRLSNLILWLFYNEDCTSESSRYINYQVLKNVNHELYESKLGKIMVSKEEIDEYVGWMRNEIVCVFNKLVAVVNDERNYDDSKKYFKGFKNNLFMSDLLKFYMLYIKYFVYKGNMAIQTIRNLASDYLAAIFPEQCTNKSKLKYFVSKTIESMIEEKKGNLEEIVNGKFDIQESKSQNIKGELEQSRNDGHSIPTTVSAFEKDGEFSYDELNQDSLSAINAPAEKSNK